MVITMTAQASLHYWNPKLNTEENEKAQQVDRGQLRYALRASLRASSLRWQKVRLHEERL